MKLNMPCAVTIYCSLKDNFAFYWMVIIIIIIICLQKDLLMPFLL